MFKIASVREFSKDRLYMEYYRKSKIKTIAEIAREFDVGRSTVTHSSSFYKANYCNNREVRHQIMLGSILGDGYLQKTKNGVYKYRESHSKQELEYAMWKYLRLCEWSDGTKIIDKNKEEDGGYSAVELYTSATASSKIEQYYNLSVEDVIDKIDINGLIIFLFDDGWYTDHSKEGSLNISSGELSEAQLNAIIEKFHKYNIDCSLIGRKKDISINSNANYILLSYALRLFGTLNIDVIEKKFGRISNKLNEKLL